jgi:hypothetical protein
MKVKGRTYLKYVLSAIVIMPALSTKSRLVHRSTSDLDLAVDKAQNYITATVVTCGVVKGRRTSLLDPRTALFPPAEHN